MRCDTEGATPDPEMSALRAGFCRVVGRWRLTQAEVRSVLGLEEPCLLISVASAVVV